MKYRILHLFPDLMNLYGDYANLSILMRYMTEEGCDAEIVRAETLPDLSDIDLMYIGCGTERSSLRALDLLLPESGKLERYLEAGGEILLTGTAYEIFCRSIADDRDGDRKGLRLIPADVSRTHGKRFLGDVIYAFGEKKEKVIGFVNKCSQTVLDGDPLFAAGQEQGNTRGGGSEGYCAGGITATGLAGPLLIKNPYVCRWYLDRLYRRRGYSPASRADMSVQQAAFDAAYRELLELRRTM